MDGSAKARFKNHICFFSSFYLPWFASNKRSSRYTFYRRLQSAQRKIRTLYCTVCVRAILIAHYPMKCKMSFNLNFIIQKTGLIQR